MSEWQPIETAPRDGRWILVIVQGRLPATQEPFIPEVVRWGKDPFLGECGWLFPSPEFGTEVMSDIVPTHWMPLPDPPDSTPHTAAHGGE